MLFSALLQALSRFPNSHGLRARRLRARRQRFSFFLGRPIRRLDHRIRGVSCSCKCPFRTPQFSVQRTHRAGLPQTQTPLPQSQKRVWAFRTRGARRTRHPGAAHASRDLRRLFLARSPRGIRGRGVTRRSPRTRQCTFTRRPPAAAPVVRRSHHRHARIPADRAAVARRGRTRVLQGRRQTQIRSAKSKRHASLPPRNSHVGGNKRDVLCWMMHRSTLD